MIFGNLNKKEIKIAKNLEKKLRKKNYTDITIKKNELMTSTFVVSAIEPLGKRVITTNMSIVDMKNRIK